MSPTDPTDPHAGSALDVSQGSAPVGENPFAGAGAQSGPAASAPGSDARVTLAAGAVTSAAGKRASAWPEVSTPEQLGEARERLEWSVADAAAKLGMVPRQIEALERGDWNALPGLAFVRGAIRAYGKALQVDIGPLLASIGGTVGAAELRPAASLEAPLPRRGALGFDNGGSGSRLTWILLGLLGVVAIALYFGRGPQWAGMLQEDSRGAAGAQRGTEAPAPAADARTRAPDGAAAALPEPLQPPAPLPAPAAPAQPPAADPAAPTGSGASATRGPEASSEAAQASSAAAGNAGSTAPAGAGAASDPATLRFRFEEASWVEVRDASGKLMLYGMQPADTTREVAGRRPYRLVIGNAAHVRLQHDGRDVDLGAISRQGVARLRID